MDQAWMRAGPQAVQPHWHAVAGPEVLVVVPPPQAELVGPLCLLRLYTQLTALIINMQCGWIDVRPLV